MKDRTEPLAVSAERGSGNVFSLAFTVGFFCFLLTGAIPGGLSDWAGFLLGFFSVLLLYVLLAVVESYGQRQAAAVQQLQMRAPAGVSITQTESENGVTIQIFVSKPLAPSRNP